MSISGIGSSILSSLSPEILAQMRGAPKGENSEEFASSFVNEKDGDGNGTLSLTETGFDEKRFTGIDSDGDGQLSEEEVAADVEKRWQENGQMMGGLGMLMQGMPGKDGKDFASALISESDADGDGSLNSEESGLSSELFSALDTDGDGQITTEEINAAMQPLEGMGTPGGQEQAAAVADSSTASATAASTDASSASSSSSSDEEEYDAYDLNEDGVVTMDELRQAFAAGDISLSSLFKDGNAREGDRESGMTGESGQSALMRMAMRAYQAQDGNTSAGLQSAVA